MRYRFATFLLLGCVAGCASPLSKDKQTFSVFFAPYTADLDQQALDTVHAASALAKDHPLQPVVLVGYAAPPDPGKDMPGLSGQRASAVQTILVRDGVKAERISTIANGTTDPKDNMPNLSVRRVDIKVGG